MKMHRHSILLCSSYNQGRRICLHTVGTDDEPFSQLVDKIGDAYDGKRVAFSVHTIMTDSEDWGSVVKSDPYFSDVTVVSCSEMLESLQKDRYLAGAEVARYILSMVPCTHTRLEKLTYMCYADYLCSTGERLFEDTIYAFDHGPVVKSVYDRYGKSSHERPGELLIGSSDAEIHMNEELRLPLKSRVVFAEDGWDKDMSIERTLKRCSKYSTSELVEITHRPESPWDITPKDTPYSVITDESIKAYHKNEIDS